MRCAFPVMLLLACGGSPRPDPMVGKYAGPQRVTINALGQDASQADTSAIVEVVEEEDLVVVTANCRYSTTRNEDGTASLADAVCRFRIESGSTRTEVVRSGTMKLEVSGRLALNYTGDFIDRLGGGILGVGDQTVSFLGDRE